jgi:hypothetical protein
MAVTQRWHYRTMGLIPQYQKVQNHTAQSSLIILSIMEIIDLEGNEIEVTDLDLAIMHADDYLHYRVNEPAKIHLHLYAYWEDLYQKICRLKNE